MCSYPDFAATEPLPADIVHGLTAVRKSSLDRLASQSGFAEGTGSPV